MRQYQQPIDSPAGIAALQVDNIIARSFVIGEPTATGEVIVLSHIEPTAAQEELARRGLKYFGPGTRPLHYDAWVKTVVFCWGGFNILGLLALIVYTVLMRARPAFKAATVEFCVGIDFGLILISCAGFAFATEPLGNAAGFICKSRVWLLALGYFIPFTLLFAKTYRLYRIFNNQKIKGQVLTTSTLAVFVLLIWLILLIFLSIWTIFDPPLPMTEINAGLSTPFVENVVNPLCSINSWTIISSFSAMLVVTLGCAVLAYRTRRLPSKYKEANQIFFCVFFLLVYSILIMPVNFLTTDINALALIRGVGCQFAALTIAVGLMGPKVLHDERGEVVSSGGSATSGNSSKETRRGTIRGTAGFFKQKMEHGKIKFERARQKSINSLRDVGIEMGRHQRDRNDEFNSSRKRTTTAPA
jgi:hypothetical protein